MRREVSTRDLSESDELLLDSWFVYHGVDLSRASQIDVSAFGYLYVTYKDSAYDHAMPQVLPFPL